MRESDRIQTTVAGFACRMRLVLGAAIVTAMLAACGGDDSPTAEAASSGASPGNDTGLPSTAGAGSAAGAATGGAIPGGGGTDADAGPVGGGGAVADDDSGSGAAADSVPGGASAGGGAAVVPVASAPGATTLSWTPPTLTEEGAPLHLTGYRIYWGPTEGYYPYSVTLNNPGLTRHVVEELAPATWYFVATALADGRESEFSNAIAMQVR